jgi:hypothetical protein
MTVDRIYAPVIPNTNQSPTSLPGVTLSGDLPYITLTSSGKSGELYTRTPFISNISGNTADYLGQLFLNSTFDLSYNYLHLIYGFIPNYYIDVHKNIEVSMSRTTGPFYLPKGASRPGGNKEIRWEVITISYNTASFLTNLSGASSTAITGLNIIHDIVPGGQTLTGEYIFYRKIGELS